MEKSIFAYVRKHTARQVLLILLIMAPMFGMQIMMYQLPKTIIDDAIGGDKSLYTVLGIELTRLDYLWVLCGSFLALVMLIGIIKFIVQTMTGIMAERLLRRLRFELLARTLHFPPRHFQKTSQSEIVTMVTAEVEPLGGFFGDAYVQPVFQGGIFLVVLGFLFSQNIILGIVASMSMPIQAWLVPRLQKRIRQLGKQRVKVVRELSERIGETVSGMGDLRANDSIQYVQSDLSHRLGKIFNIRYEIYRRKFFMKFLNNFISQLTPFFFYSIGGYLVITGRLSLGMLTAGLVAYKDLAAPWKELLTWYQLQADSAVKYDSLLEQFQPTGMLTVEPAEEHPPALPDWLGQTLTLENVTLKEGEDTTLVRQVSTQFRPGEPVLITGSAASGKNELARLLAGLEQIDSGRIAVGDQDLSTLPRSVRGCRIGYVGAASIVFSGSLRDNLLLGLKRRPQASESKPEHAAYLKEAVASGNSQLPFEADWLTLEDVGLNDQAGLQARYLQVFTLLGMDNDLYRSGLQATLADPQQAQTDKLLQARQRLMELLQQQGSESLVQRFVPTAFNRYASVAENVVYGQPTDSFFALNKLGQNHYVRSLLAEQGLQETFLSIGLQLAHLLVDLFKDSASDSFIQEQFSFVSAEDLPEYLSIVRRYDSSGATALTQADKNRLCSLPFHLTPQRHRLNLIDAELEQRLVRLRHAFRESMPRDWQDKVIFLEEDAYNPGLSIHANILFGRTAHGRAHVATQLEHLIDTVVDELGLRQIIILSALERDVGKGGSRLPQAQRQLLALARMLMKNPHILIIDEALSALSASERAAIASRLIAAYPDRVLLWVDHNLLESTPFQHRLEMQAGRLQNLEGIRSEAPEAASSAEPTPAETATDTEEETGLSTLATEVKQLRMIPLFAGLERNALRLLAFASEVVHFDAGETVFAQGETGDCAYVILRGQGEIWLTQDQHAHYKLNEVAQNALIGEMTLLGDPDTRRSASFVAKTEMDCLKISREVFVELVQQNAQVATQLTRLLSQRLQTTLQQLNARQG